jgi:beta-phosphoglucomutase-like phosphatase (HAD superfamily)
LPYLHEVLAKTSLTSYFGDRIYSARQRARPKPAPDLFLHAAEVLGFAPEECLVVEDSVPGITAAKRANMKVIGFMAGLHFNEVIQACLLSAEADHYCSDSAELQQLITTICK